MHWQQIVGFYYVVKLGSYSKAAEVTHRTQSAVTQQVQALEKLLDCHLVRRSGRSRVLSTPEGQEFFRFCEKMLKEHREMTDRIRSIRANTDSTLVIGGPTDTMSMVLPPFAKRFLSNHPDVQLRLLECPLDTVVSGVRKGDIDIGLGMMTHIPSDLKQLHWKPLDHHIIAHDDHPFWNGPASLENIARYPLILPARSEHAQTSDILLNELAKEGLSAKIALETNSVASSIDHTREKTGIYFALCSREMLGGLPENIRAASLKHLFRSESIGVFYDGKRALQPREQAFLELLGIVG